MYGSGEAQSNCRNVGTEERVISGILGGICLAHGVETRIVPRPMSLLLAVGLIYRAVTGHCSGYSLLGLSTADEAGRPSGQMRSCPPVVTGAALAATGEMPRAEALNR